MKRQDEKRLQLWLSEAHRKPLVLRGARQVGKSTLVRQFAAQQGLTLNEVNLERHLGLDKVFATLDTSLIRAELEAPARSSGGRRRVPAGVCARPAQILHARRPDVSREERSRDVKAAIGQLSMARICHRVFAGRQPSADGLARATFDLISLPLYAVGELGRLLDGVRNESEK